MKIETRNCIGQGFSTGTGKTFQAVNPATNEFLSEKFYVASATDADAALQKADESYATFAALDWDKRALFLEEIAHQMEALGDGLLERASLETGLPIGRLAGERGRTTGQLRMFADYIRQGRWVEATIETAQPARTPLPKPDLRKMMQPLGPVIVFGSSNFPLAYSVAGGDTAAALAAGCPVVVKAHPAHPGTSALVAMAILKAAQLTHMPEGVFSLLYCNGFTIGEALVTHPKAAAVGFTGSLNGGRALFNLAAQRPNPIPVFAEMGSTNPVVLLPGALSENAKTIAAQYADSITLGVGQFCTNPGLLLGIKGPELTQFKEALAALLSAKLPETMLHKGISQAFNTKSSDMLAQPEVALLAQSDTHPATGAGRPMVATASGTAFKANPALHQEVFGPFSLLIECDDLEELKTCVSTLQGQLTGTLIGTDTEWEASKSLVQALTQKVGRVIFNGVPTGVEVCAAMQHGGPYPATTDARFTAVGVDAIKRFLRPVAFQNTPDALLPKALQNANPLQISRRINGAYTHNAL